ncbi:MAG: hypothetical protein Fur0025_25400 [Oscillatoriaceae cyanobacterium]
MKGSEIVIIGGGIIGLSIAIELKLRGVSACVLSHNSSASAGNAAAGMLAPQAEQLTGPMRDLSLRSRSLYPDWVSKLEELTGSNTGYWPCGILAPVYTTQGGEGEQGDNMSPNLPKSPSYWLDKQTIRQYQSGLGDDVVGGWWFPEDAQVNNRALMKTLEEAARSLRVEYHDGVEVLGLQQRHGKVERLQTTAGDFHADRYVLATGARASQLLPIPVYPKKGQMLSVRAPAELTLQRVLFGPDTYIVPRRNGQIVIGATSEDVGFTPGNTPAGCAQLLNRAIRLYPALADYPIEEFWWGFRPGTPDELPILGASLCENLFLATGHYRNGVLLAPVTAALIADLVINDKADPLLKHFELSRFSQRNSVVEQGNPVNVKQSEQIMLTIPATPAAAERFSSGYLESIDQPLVIAGRQFKSRLFTGTGRYRNLEEMRQAIDASGCEIVTVAVRRVQTNAEGHAGIAEAIDWTKIWMLPNTAGCQTAEEAIRVARLGREMAKLLGQEDNNFIKLEVIPDAKYLLPDPIGTLQAAEQLVKEGFAVLPYINTDPLLAKRLEDVGCATVMPLGSAIGSGQGIQSQANIQIIIENAKVPVVVDAGIGVPSEAALALEMGASAVLINTAIAQAQNPAAMARGMAMAVEAGRLAYLAGRIPIKTVAAASSPLTGTITT